GAVPAVDHQHLRLHERDGLQRHPDLIDVLDLVMKDILMLGAKAPDPREQRPVAARLRVGKERDPRHGGQDDTGRNDPPWRYLRVTGPTRVEPATEKATFAIAGFRLNARSIS